MLHHPTRPSKTILPKEMVRGCIKSLQKRSKLQGSLQGSLHRTSHKNIGGSHNSWRTPYPYFKDCTRQCSNESQVVSNRNPGNRAVLRLRLNLGFICSHIGTKHIITCVVGTHSPP